MHHSFTLAASLLTLLPTVFAAGTAHVVNNCGTDVWFASVAQNVGAPMQKMASGGSYSETYNKVNVGISIKLAATYGGPVTQFEFTWDSPNINYDISNIDGNPFAQQGMSLVPSSIGAAGYPSCVAVNCPAGESRCDAAYNLPDDVRTKVCPEDSDLTFTLCPGGAVAPAPPAASSSSAKASASVPASTPGRGPVASAAPTSFITSTTAAASVPIASPPAAKSSQNQAPAPVASDPAQTTAAAAPVTTPVGNAPQNPAPTVTWTWTRGGGGWGGHYHTKRAHMHNFHS